MTKDLLISALPDTITTSRLALRQPLEADAEAMAALANNRRIASMVSRLPSPYGRSDALEFITRGARNAHEHAYAVTLRDGTLAGVISFHFETGHAPEIGYWFGEPFWGQGYATEAANTLLRIIDARAPMELEARAISSNAASLHILQKCGFAVTGERMGACGANKGVMISSMVRKAGERHKTTNPRLARDLPETIAMGHLVLRNPEMGDADTLAALANNPRIYRMTATMPYPYTVSDAQEFIAERETLDDERAYVIDHESFGAVGVVGVHLSGHAAPEIGYWLGEPYWGRNIATDAAGMLIGAMDAITPVTLQAWALCANKGSIRVLEKLGFDKLGEKPSSRERHQRALVSFHLRESHNDAHP